MSEFTQHSNIFNHFIIDFLNIFHITLIFLFILNTIQAYYFLAIVLLKFLISKLLFFKKILYIIPSIFLFYLTFVNTKEDNKKSNKFSFDLALILNVQRYLDLSILFIYCLEF